MRLKGRGHWERKCKKSFFFANIFVNGESIYIKPRMKWSLVHSNFLRIFVHFTIGNAARNILAIFVRSLPVGQKRNCIFHFFLGTPIPIDKLSTPVRCTMSKSWLSLKFRGVLQSSSLLQIARGRRLCSVIDRRYSNALMLCWRFPALYNPLKPTVAIWVQL